MKCELLPRTRDMIDGPIPHYEPSKRDARAHAPQAVLKGHSVGMNCQSGSRNRGMITCSHG
ncbi:MAG: hypothetical protein CMJ40_02630 [Phycisphaerae bacterium]|nr:hypothetical protein [Phycisphaerae bacterium]